MDLFTFFFACFSVFFTAVTSETLAKVGFKAWSRYLRSKNIREKGWPPEHMDADGDFRPEKKDS